MTVALLKKILDLLSKYYVVRDLEVFGERWSLRRRDDDLN